MATNVASTQTGGLLYAGVAWALRINRRIENDEIPLFMQRCVIDATRWEVGGTQYEQWRAENGMEKIPPLNGVTRWLRPTTSSDLMG